VRMVVRTSIGGDRARIRLTNAFGAPVVVVGAACLALRASGSATVPGSDRAVSFGGEGSVVLHPGTVVFSDPVDIDVPAVGDLVVSLYLGGPAGRPTTHSLGLHTTYISPPGDFTAREDFEAVRTTQSYYWIAGVDVMAPADGSTIVAFGNSITDGARSTADADRDWPARLAARLAANEATGRVGVVNAGISGNRVLSDGAGVSVLARLDRDALSYSGVKWVILMEGINDIGGLTRGRTNPVVTADRLIWAYRQVIDRAHAQGVKVAGATLTPYEGAGYFSEEGEAIRAAANEWIRTSGAFDAVIDFDAATRDPSSPRRFLPAYDPGDHLHPNDTGYQAMADAIDLSIFAPSSSGEN
jgi:lysophospholipase L1-like esterase